MRIRNSRENGEGFGVSNDTPTAKKPFTAWPCESLVVPFGPTPVSNGDECCRLRRNFLRQIIGHEFRLRVGLQRTEPLRLEAALGIRRCVAARIDEFDQVDAHLAGFAAQVYTRDQVSDGIGDALDRQFPVKLLDGVREHIVDADDFLSGEKHA